MDEYEIKSVKIVDGETLNPRWHTQMQIVLTDKGEFIDNIPQKQFGFFRKANSGFNWKTLIGKKTRKVKIFDSRGFKWINYQE